MDLYRDNFQVPTSNSQLGAEEIASLVYHDIFDYPLTFSELIKWRGGNKLTINHQSLAINLANGFYFLDAKAGVVYKRLLKKRTSIKKLEIAKSAAHVLAAVPTIKMVGITGALAMGNSSEDSDVDLMVVTSKGMLWTTRLITLIVLKFLGIATRRAGEREEKDKLCLNMWMDEEDLVWRKGRNAYSAHEIAQILPLVNKAETYEKFIWKNRWVTEFWPNSVRIGSMQHVASSKAERTILHATFYLLLSIVENLAFQFQYQHMKPKITREVVTPTRALFHPIDWGKVVLQRLSS